MDILFFFKSFILGAVQGFTEFIPISSTADLILGSKLLNLELNDFLKSFIIIIQLASILAVILIYWKKITSSSLYLKKIITAFIPTAIIGFIMYNVVRNFLQESLDIIALALFLGGIAIIILERKYKEREVEEIKKIEDISYKQCLMIGVFQALAIIPGVSRSAATILGGLSLGIGRLAIVEFSFLLAIPTMLAASSLDIIKNGVSFSGNEFVFLAIGFITSFIVAWFSIKFLLDFIKRNSFVVFGWYRFFLGTLIFLFLYVL